MQWPAGGRECSCKMYMLCAPLRPAVAGCNFSRKTLCTVGGRLFIKLYVRLLPPLQNATGPLFGVVGECCGMLLFGFT